jgi:two-component system, OmpR family, sensor histidine kinase BaeS
MTRRFLFSNLILILVTLFVFSLTTVTATQAAFDNFQETHTAVHTRLLVDVLENHYRQQESWEGVQLEILNLSLISGFVITLQDANGEIVGSTLGTANANGRDLSADLIYKLGDGVNRPMGTLFVDRNNELQQIDARFLEEITSGFFFAGAMVFGLALVLAVLMAHPIGAPLREMGEAASHIAQGEYAIRVAEDGPAEVGVLGRAFNQMATSLHQLEQMRRDLVLNVSHDLRTPLTIVQGYLEGLQTGRIADRRTAEQAFAAMHAETTHLLHLVHSLSQVAALDAGQVQWEMAPLDVAEWVEQVVARAMPLAQAQGVSLTAELPPALPPLQGEATQLSQLLFNLLENGVRHTAAGGQVHVGAVATAAQTLQLTITDTGEGIPPEHLPHIFERFYRADTARSRHSGGAGLGLAIAQGVAHAHGGRITCTSTVGVGTHFIVELNLLI